MIPVLQSHQIIQAIGSPSVGHPETRNFVKTKKGQGESVFVTKEMKEKQKVTIVLKIYFIARSFDSSSKDLFLNGHSCGDLSACSIIFPPKRGNRLGFSVEVDTLFAIEMTISQKGSSGTREGHHR